MPFFLKYKNWIIGIGILFLIFIAYMVFGKSSTSKESTPTCPNTFTVNPLGNLVPDSVSITYSSSGGKYYSQTKGGIAGYGLQLAPKEITKDKFMEACKSYQAQQMPS